MFEEEAELWRYLEAGAGSPDDWRYLELLVESAGACRNLEPGAPPGAAPGAGPGASPEVWRYLELLAGSPTPRRLVLLPYTPLLLSSPLL